MSLNGFDSVMHLKGECDVSCYGGEQPDQGDERFNGEAAQALLHKLSTYSKVAQLAECVDPMKHVVEAVRDSVVKRATSMHSI
jgi:hypothetical protein